MIAAYFNTEPAQLDYQAVIDAGVKIDGAACVSRDHAGELHVEETDHMARKGAEVLGGAGLVVGLFAPPLSSPPRSARPRADPGQARALRHEEQDQKQAFETIPYGGAGLIAAYPRSSAEGIDKAVSRALKATADDQSVAVANQLPGGDAPGVTEQNGNFKYVIKGT
jgi:hypothetical protein